MTLATTAIVMPQLGVSVTEGVVTVWHKRPGDAIVADETVCEISTDKVDTEVTAPTGGVLAEILVDAGSTVAVGEALALIAVEGEAPAADPVPQSTPRPNGAPRPGPTDFAAEAERAVSQAQPGAVVASPVARRIADAHDIDLRSISGSGMNGRIRKQDVLAAVDGKRALRSPASLPPRTPAEPPRVDLSSSPRGLPRGFDDVPHTLVVISPVRRAIAEHMIRSRRTAAHMTTEVEVDMHRVLGIRGKLNDQRRAGDLAKLSILPFVARAACAAVLDFPNLNATFDDDRIVHWREVNLAIAVDTERGLLAPVIRRCERLNIVGIADQVADLAQRARAGALTPDDMRAGTFTLSNPESVGAISAMAIINQPQVAILGLPAIVKRVRVIGGPDGEDVVAVRPVMQLALTFDHRAVDGADATRCAVAIKSRLETWDAAAYL